MRLHGDGTESHIGYWIAVHAWNRGYATESVRAVIAYGFDHLGQRRIEASCFPENAASARVLEKAGMTFQRTLPAHLEKEGVLRDVSVYAIERPNPARS
jgi:RimJ/RimL family protein N-acetyltransferase